MDINTTRFGLVHIEDADVINMSRGIFGFDDLKKYIIIPHRSAKGPFSWFQSIDDPKVAFVICAPGDFLKNYQPSLDNDTKKQILADGEDTVAIFNIVRFEDGGKKVLANLCAPIIVNMNKKLAIQCILDDKKFPIRYNLFQT